MMRQAGGSMIARSTDKPEVVRAKLRLDPDPTRVIARSFIPSGEGRVKAVVDRVLAMSDGQVSKTLARVMLDFNARHRNVRTLFARHFGNVAHEFDQEAELSHERRLLIGAYFTSEYSVESVALFNPSMVAHPDQRGLLDGEKRFLLSLRACGEGHVSSIEFRSGVVDTAGRITLDPTSPFAFRAKPVDAKLYEKHPFFLKLLEMGAYSTTARSVLDDLDDHFTLADLSRAVEAHHVANGGAGGFEPAAEALLWLAHSNYHLHFPVDTDMSERVIFPVTENESRGIEDARFVRFTYDNGRVVYYATYAAYNGFQALPQFIETSDFIHFKIITLNGRCAQNKGMALFPRKIDGKYMMIARLDGESLHLLASENVHFWNRHELLDVPAQPWELMQLGNCGSPIETDAGWLLLTHGVGPMRRYCIGAILLDLDNPHKVIGRVVDPILEPIEGERDGYVPNVVYTCGAMVHGDLLIIPYAICDTATSFATVGLPDLLAHMLG